MLADHRDGLSISSFLASSSIAQSVCQRAFSLLANRCLRPWVRIPHSAAEDNLSPFDSNIACLCQSIEINNNKQVCMYVLHSAEEDNLSPFDSKIACLYQSIKINNITNNIYIYISWFVIFCCGYIMTDLRIFFRHTSLALWGNNHVKIQCEWSNPEGYGYTEHTDLLRTTMLPQPYLILYLV